MAKKDFIRQADKAGSKNSKELAKDAFAILGIGLAAGTALIAATNNVMTKIQEEKEKLAKKETQDEDQIDETDL